MCCVLQYITCGIFGTPTKQADSSKTFEQIAEILTDVLVTGRGVDIVASDVVAGLCTLRVAQRARQTAADLQISLPPLFNAVATTGLIAELEGHRVPVSDPTPHVWDIPANFSYIDHCSHPRLYRIIKPYMYVLVRSCA